MQNYKGRMKQTFSISLKCSWEKMERKARYKKEQEEDRRVISINTLRRHENEKGRILRLFPGQNHHSSFGHDTTPNNKNHDANWGTASRATGIKPGECSHPHPGFPHFSVLSTKRKVKSNWAKAAFRIGKFLQNMWPWMSIITSLKSLLLTKISGDN